MSYVQLRLHSVSDLCPHDYVFMLFCKIYILVHAITYEIWSTSELRVRLAPLNRFKPSSKIFY